MRKLFLLAALTIGMVASSVAQLAIPGEIFAQNPSRFNGRKVTIKNIEIVSTHSTQNGTITPGLIGTTGPIGVGAPGPVGSSTAPATPCRPPRGFSKIEIFFKGAPEFKACFFMADNMKTQMDRECGHENTPAQITFRGDHRTGYAVTFYRLGN